MKQLGKIEMWIPPVETPCKSDPDLWSDTDLVRKRALRNEAIRICKTQCPVKDDCLEAALLMEDGLSKNYRSGIWGGTGPATRTLIDRRRRGLTDEDMLAS